MSFVTSSWLPLIVLLVGGLVPLLERQTWDKKLTDRQANALRMRVAILSALHLSLRVSH